MNAHDGAMARRLVTIPALVLAAATLTLLAPLWGPLAGGFDAMRGRHRLPTVRLLAFGVCWSWLELGGVSTGLVLWMCGLGRNRRLHYALQRWWAANLLGALRATCGIGVSTENLDAFTPGPVLVFVRHASLADSLVSAYVITTLAGLRPRFVLKKELLSDPCLDVIGRRIPNHFLDRGANDSAPELAALRALVDGLGPHDAGIIFPEGTRANDDKRAAALVAIARTDPARAARLDGMRHLLPPRIGGAAAMADGAPGADVVLAWHVGFEGLDTFGGILRGLGRTIEPIRFVARRVRAVDVPRDDGFAAWLDEQWVRMDNEVDAALQHRQDR